MPEPTDCHIHGHDWQDTHLVVVSLELPANLAAQFSLAPRLQVCSHCLMIRLSPKEMHHASE